MLANQSSALLFFFLLLVNPAHGKNRCDVLFQANMVALNTIKEIDFTKTPEFAELQKTYPDLKPMAQYGQTGTLILHASSLSLDGYKYYQSLLSHLPADVRTLLVGSASDYDSFVRFNFSHQARKIENESASESLDTFLQVQNEVTPTGSQNPVSRWVQDHMGLYVTYKGWDNKPVVAMVTSDYRFNYKISDQLAKYLGVQIIKNISGQHEWGNFTVIGDTGYTVYGPRTHSSLKLEDFMATGVRRLVLLPQPKFGDKGLGIPHTDEFLIPLSENHVLTNVADYFEYFKGQGKRVELLPSNADIGLDHLTYTNAVLVNGENNRVLFVPQFGGLSATQLFFGAPLGAEAIKTLKQRDKEALNAYRVMAKELNITVVPVHSAEATLNNFGGIHCATGICAATPNADRGASWYPKGDGPL